MHALSDDSRKGRSFEVCSLEAFAESSSAISSRTAAGVNLITREDSDGILGLSQSAQICTGWSNCPQKKRVVAYAYSFGQLSTEHAIELSPSPCLFHYAGRTCAGLPALFNLRLVSCGQCFRCSHPGDCALQLPYRFHAERSILSTSEAHSCSRLPPG